MALKLRRGTDTERQGVVFSLGELVFTTDTKQLYIGDGVTSGGLNSNQYAVGYGLKFNSSTQLLELDTSDLEDITMLGILTMTPQQSAPSLPQEGMIAIANRVNWDPANKGSGRSYPVYFDGATWNSFY